MFLLFRTFRWLRTYLQYTNRETWDPASVVSVLEAVKELAKTNETYLYDESRVHLAGYSIVSTPQPLSTNTYLIETTLSNDRVLSEYGIPHSSSAILLHSLRFSPLAVHAASLPPNSPSSLLHLGTSRHFRFLQQPARSTRNNLLPKLSLLLQNSTNLPLPDYRGTGLHRSLKEQIIN